ncbi:hypothetical protein [Streptomyces chrestomyceticus]|uniref:hypothetical protein n=1 Tax=Streptomyces chrestomyceticus TaxID=68185 RepID=UPI0037B3E2B5
MQETITAPGFRGCAFVNAWAELGGPGHERHPLVAEAVQEHKTLLRAYLTGLAGVFGDARGVGEQIHILIEGAMVTSSILGADGWGGGMPCGGAAQRTRTTELIGVMLYGADSPTPRITTEQPPVPLYP